MIRYLLVCLLLSVSSLADTDRIEFTRIDPGTHLLGTAYYMDRSPVVPAEIRDESGIVEGYRSLRVTLHWVEESSRMVVESIFTSRTGATRVDWAAELWEQEFHLLQPGAPPFHYPPFRWVGRDAFEFACDSPRIDPITGTQSYARRRTRFTLIGDGVFSVATTIGPKILHELDDHPIPEDHVKRRYANHGVTLTGIAGYPTYCVAMDSTASVALEVDAKLWYRTARLIVLDDCSLRVELMDAMNYPISAHTFDEIAAGPYAIRLDQEDLPDGAINLRIWQGDRLIGDTRYVRH